jgi:hypothetical protein
VIGLSGQLGNGVLGAFQLGTPLTGATFVPHRGRAHSRLTRDNVRSAVRATKVRSSITAAKASAEVSDG